MKRTMVITPKGYASPNPMDTIDALSVDASMAAANPGVLVIAPAKIPDANAGGICINLAQI